MLLNRVRQFFLSIFSRISADDINFVEKYLDDFERQLFFNLKESEQKHCIRVAALAEYMCRNKNLNANRVIRAGLLHDVGKGIKRINIFEKVLMVILDNIFGKKLLYFSFFNFVDSYYNHANIGYNVLKNHISDDKLLNLILNHHNKIEGNIELEIIRYCDNNN